jgi:hypothetical protein
MTDIGTSFFYFNLREYNGVLVLPEAGRVRSRNSRLKYGNRREPGNRLMSIRTSILNSPSNNRNSFSGLIEWPIVKNFIFSSAVFIIFRAMFFKAAKKVYHNFF